MSRLSDIDAQVTSLAAGVDTVPYATTAHQADHLIRLAHEVQPLTPAGRRQVLATAGRAATLRADVTRSSGRIENARRGIDMAYAYGTAAESDTIAATARFVEATAFLDAGKPGAALGVIDQALSLSPPPALQVRLLLDQARAYATLHDLRAAFAAAAAADAAFGRVDPERRRFGGWQYDAGVAWMEVVHHVARSAAIGHAVEVAVPYGAEALREQEALGLPAWQATLHLELACMHAGFGHVDQVLDHGHGALDAMLLAPRDAPRRARLQRLDRLLRHEPLQGVDGVADLLDRVQGTLRTA